MKANWLSEALVNHHYLILAAVAVFSLTCLVVPITLKAMPDFSDPEMGFETRGTVLANRRIAWKNLEQATRPSGPFSVNPREFLKEKRKQASKTERSKNGTNKKLKIVVNNEGGRHRNKNWTNLVDMFSKPKLQHPEIAEDSGDNFFCGPPDEQYVHVVLESIDKSDLFTLDSILIQCRMEHEFADSPHYRELCVETAAKPRRCCRPWSLGNYIAQLHNRSSCLAIMEEDVVNTKKLLVGCAEYYHNLQLAPECSRGAHCGVPSDCVKHDVVFNVMNYITATSFVPPNRSTDSILEQTMLFLPLAKSIAALPYYEELGGAALRFDKVAVVAMDFGLKNTMFDKCLVKEAWLMSLGGLFVILCIWLYTKSLFITLMAITAIVFSLAIAYFTYTLVFEFVFFPFMNILAVIVIVGIGADDVFIFCKTWESSKRDGTSTLKTMKDTFSHAFLSMLITSVTTAGAFFASYISKITTICCFSIFMTVAVIVNCILMMIWFPACVSLHEQWRWNLKCTTIPASVFNRYKILEKYTQLRCSTLSYLWANKEQIVIDTVINYRHLVLLLFSLLAAGSTFVILYYPKLQLPNSPEFQLFDRSHPFEKYDLVYKDLFWFERMEKGEEHSNSKIPLRFIWGILPIDSGNYLDPRSLGDVHLDPEFDVSQPQSQEWLLSFCHDLRKQPFYQPTHGPLLPNCFIESFTSWMQRRCFDSVYSVNRTPCCEAERFPYSSSVFNTCIVRAMSDLYETPSEYFIPGMAGPKFSKTEFPHISAVVVEYLSNYSYSVSYTHMHEFFESVETWMQLQLERAPHSMKRGWFVSHLEFYDLQQVLAEDTVSSVYVSMSLALIIVVISTMNVVTSFLAICTITCSIFVTIAILVLMGWQLNVLESIAITSAIGLTVDFTLHYTVHYTMCPTNKDRISATRYSLMHMLGPVTMAALTTGCAGALMLPSSILPYIKIAAFLAIVMTVSWCYSTFFLGALLAICGPQDRFGQLQLCRKRGVDKKGVGPRASLSDGQELNSLTSKRLIKGRGSRDHVLNNCHQSPSATSTITVIMMDDN